jgi:transposase
MTSIALTAHECGELEALLHFPLGREHCRAQALLWLAQGLAVEEIADLLDVSRQTVYNWASRFQQRHDLDPHARLADAPRSGRPPVGQGILDSLIKAVIDQAPQDFGFRSAVWTAPLLCKYLDKAHRIEVSRKTVSRALDRLDLRWKRPRHQLDLRPETWRQAKGGSSAASKAARARSC